MNDVRKQDPTFTNFVPRTAAEAVDRYVRCRRNGLKPMLVPECLIMCSRALAPKELDIFEAWIVNPNGEIPAHEKLVPTLAIRTANDSLYQETVQRVEAALAVDPLPPLPYTGYEEDDEKYDEIPEMPRMVRCTSTAPPSLEDQPIELIDMTRLAGLLGCNLPLCLLVRPGQVPFNLSLRQGVDLLRPDDCLKSGL